MWQKIKCGLFGHRYRIHRTDMILYGVYDITFECRCGVKSERTIRTSKIEDADFWLSKAVKLQPPRYFP
jgi:hypothetical protein